nr:helix-turn-helix transcriptional regulator [uncultured Desulfobacter sp.]
MSFFAMTDKAIIKEIGRRLKSTRLRKNMTQKEVAEATGLSLNAVQTAEKGASKMMTYVKILRVLNALDSLDNFLPEVNISPLALAKMAGKKRKRASGARLKDT